MQRNFDEERENIRGIIDQADLPKGGKVLDIGTGMGWMATSLAKNGYQVVTIEEHPEFQADARELARSLGVEEKIEFKIGNITSVPFARESFDGVVVYLTLHHLTDLESTIEKMIELCKQGGKVLIVELTKQGMARVSRHRADHAHQLVDPSRLLEAKRLDCQTFPGEFTNVHVCQKNREGDKGDEVDI